MKKKKDFSNKIELICLIIALLMGIFFMVGSMQDFWRGFHNVDLSFNDCIVANDLNIDFRLMGDNYDIGKSMLVTDLYIIGMKQIQSSINWMMIWALLTGCCIMRLFDMKNG